MPRLTSTMEGDAVIFHIDIESQDKEKNWCIIVSSKSNYASGFYVPTIATILEYPYKVDTFCGKDSQIIKKMYPMPGEYLAVLGIGSKEMVDTNPLDTINQTTTVSGPIVTKFAIVGLSITDKDVENAKKILSCMADIHEYSEKKGEKVFDNMMLEPIFSTIVEFFNNIANKRDISPYVDSVRHRINFYGPTLKEGKYFWPIIYKGKYVEYAIE
jgi:hypothetical protein